MRVPVSFKICILPKAYQINLSMIHQIFYDALIFLWWIFLCCIPFNSCKLENAHNFRLTRGHTGPTVLIPDPLFESLHLRIRNLHCTERKGRGGEIEKDSNSYSVCKFFNSATDIFFLESIHAMLWKFCPT